MLKSYVFYIYWKRNENMFFTEYLQQDTLAVLILGIKATLSNCYNLATHCRWGGASRSKPRLLLWRLVPHQLENEVSPSNQQSHRTHT